MNENSLRLHRRVQWFIQLVILIKSHIIQNANLHKLSLHTPNHPHFLNILPRNVNNFYIVLFHTVFYPLSDKGALHTLWSKKGNSREKMSGFSPELVRYQKKTADYSWQHGEPVSTTVSSDGAAGRSVVAIGPACRDVIRKEDRYDKVAMYW